MLYRSVTLAAAAAVAVSASPIRRDDAKVITVPLTYHSHVESMSNLVAKGRAKLDLINGRTSNERRQSSGSVTNDDVSYVASVDIGGSTWSLIVDTGSSNTWCGAHTSCEPTSSGQDTGDTVKVSYGSGSFSGEEYTDSVSFGGETVNSQSVGAATSATGFNNVDGIIGFGPVDLTQNTVSNTNEVPTFMDNLYSQGSIPVEVLGVSFAPENGGDTNDNNGELTLGGTDSSKYQGSLAYNPTLTSGAAAPYWGLAINSFTYNGETLSSNNQGIIDTGTTLIYIPTSAFNNFLSATGGSQSSQGMAQFNSEPTGTFAIEFGSDSFTLDPSQYLVPQDQYDEFGLASGKYYSWISNGGSSGVDSIIGQKFLENYYAAFDTTNSQIGFAPRA